MIAIVPARGGSKGLPGKNIKPLFGKPLIAYTLECALESKAIDRVIISTDSQEIADIAVKYGAECPFLRPTELASDKAMAVDNYIYTIDRMEDESGQIINEFMVLQPTSPLRIPEDIDNAAKIYFDKKADSVISYTPDNHPISWHKFITDEGKFQDILPVTIANRQDMKMSYYPNGAIYVFSKDLIKQRKYYSENTFAYVMPRNRSVDIDYQEDFDYVEFLMTLKNK